MNNYTVQMQLTPSRYTYIHNWETIAADHKLYVVSINVVLVLGSYIPQKLVADDSLLEMEAKTKYNAASNTPIHLVFYVGQ